MAKWTHFYLVRIEFLGFRYHGWQKQSELKSIQGMINKTLLFILEHDNFKTLGCGRTDARVSADDFAFEFFTHTQFLPDKLLIQLNDNLPTDIRVKSVISVNSSFNIIQSAKTKEYHYNFSFGEKSHPFNAPHIYDFGAYLDIASMQDAVKLFIGKHNFKRYASKPSPNTIFEREILSAKIEKNTRFIASETPENAYVFKVKSNGFLRYQVRLMMGALIAIGKGNWTINDLQESLANPEGKQIETIAPSSGLLLHKVEFHN